MPIGTAAARGLLCSQPATARPVQHTPRPPPMPSPCPVARCARPPAPPSAVRHTPARVSARVLARVQGYVRSAMQSAPHRRARRQPAAVLGASPGCDSWSALGLRHAACVPPPTRCAPAVRPLARTLCACSPVHTVVLTQLPGPTRALLTRRAGGPAWSQLWSAYGGG
eukprot:scaffold5160_cov107-Isochrysis_galbana.AAC.3